MKKRSDFIKGFFCFLIFTFLISPAWAAAPYLSSGHEHTVMVEDNGTVWTVGRNNKGQLGSGVTSPREIIPYPVLSLTDVTAVGAGSYHSIALKSDGTMWTWGDNTYGQLGVGVASPVPTTLPIQVPGLTNVTAISGNAYHTVAINSGNVWAWGDNTYGQLGNGSVASTNSPVMVSGLNDVTAIAAGETHTVALLSDGTVWVWGDNSKGQLGNGTSTATPLTSPVQVPGLADITAISAGEAHTLALKSDGTVWAWGKSIYGQVGSGFLYRNETTPLQVLTDAIEISAGKSHSIALKSDGSVWCWGGNTLGQLGMGNNIHLAVPAEVPGLTGVSDIASGGDHSFAVLSDCVIWGWGKNGYGDLGIGDDPPPGKQNSPKESLLLCYLYTTPKGVGPYLRGGYDHTLLVKNDGGVWTVGRNDNGQLGIGLETTREVTPFRIPGLRNIEAVGAGSHHSIALGTDGLVWTWGDNTYGQLGNGTTSTTPQSKPTIVPNLENISAISGGEDYTVALKEDGTVWTWGLNDYGQLGDGTTATQTSPVQVPGLIEIEAIAAGARHTLALQNDGTLWVWGNNSFGQLGNGTTSSTLQTSPVKVPGLDNVDLIDAGLYHTIILKSDGTVWSWGRSNYGQVGTGKMYVNIKSPTQVLADVSDVNAGYLHSIALKNDGTVWVWGSNGLGQLGQGNLTHLSSPTQVPGLADVSDIAGGGDHSYAVMANCSIWGFGRNGFGDLGIGITPPVSKQSDATLTLLVSCYQAPEKMEFSLLESGYDHTLATATDGTVWSVGRNDKGQLGLGTLIGREYQPTQIPDFTDIETVGAGLHHSVALKTDGTVWAWGDNTYGQIGDGTNATHVSPVQVPGLTNITGICGGYNHTVALMSDGTIWAWGDNSSGQLGNGTQNSSSSPVQVSVIDDAVAIAAGESHTAALRSDGSLWIWGDNTYGQLGDGTSGGSPRTVPAQVPDMNFVNSVEAGKSHTMVLKSDGSVWIWGRNNYGQVGNNKIYTIERSPLLIMTDVADIGAGYLHSAALKDDNTLWVWGCNGLGQLGQGNLVHLKQPTQVPDVSIADDIAVSGDHSFAILEDCTVMGWGRNGFGDLGFGDQPPVYKQQTPRESLFEVCSSI